MGKLSEKTGRVSVLMADDDRDDQLLVQKALAAVEAAEGTAFVNDGQELLDFLNLCRNRPEPPRVKFPSLILLDLNMPRMDGREALQILKADGELREIPVVILTTSKQPEDKNLSYGSGANFYITKPENFPDFVEIMRFLKVFWVKKPEGPHS